MIVVESAIIASLYLHCAFTPQAEQLLLTESDWSAPFLWRSES